MYEDEILIIGDGSCTRCSRMYYTYSRTGIQVCNNCASSEESGDLFETEMLQKLHFLTK